MRATTNRDGLNGAVVSESGISPIGMYPHCAIGVLESLRPARPNAQKRRRGAGRCTCQPTILPPRDSPRDGLLTNAKR
jgi:hypothetical protein